MKQALFVLILLTSTLIHTHSEGQSSSTIQEYQNTDSGVDCDKTPNNPACYCETDDESLPPGQAC
jgi:hypothetical protein